MSTKHTAKKATAKRTAAKKPTTRTRVASVTPTPDLSQRWSGGILDALPDDAKKVVVAIERLVDKSDNPQRTVSQLRALVSTMRNSTFAGHVAEIRLASYHRGFVNGFLTHFGIKEGGK